MNSAQSLRKWPGLAPARSSIENGRACRWFALESVYAVFGDLDQRIDENTQAQYRCDEKAPAQDG